MTVNAIPEKVTNYNVYEGGTNKLVGITGDVTLPSLQAISETISGAGIAGEYESPTPGHFSSISMDIPFRVLYDSSFTLMVPGGRIIVLRASQQSYDMAGGQIQNRALKITIKGLPKGIDLGTLTVGKATGTKNTLEVVYIKIEENGKVLLELDKINFIYIVNSVDVLAKVRSQI